MLGPRQVMQEELFYEFSLEAQGSKLLLPNRLKDHPDRDRLAARFERFRIAV